MVSWTYSFPLYLATFLNVVYYEFHRAIENRVSSLDFPEPKSRTFLRPKNPLWPETQVLGSEKLSSVCYSETEMCEGHVFGVSNAVVYFTDALSFVGDSWSSCYLPSVLWDCWLGDRKGCKKLAVGLLLVKFNSFRPIAPVVTSAYIILSSNNIQNGHRQVLANPGPPGKMAIYIKQRERWVLVNAWC